MEMEMEMGYRCLDLTIVCAEGLKNVNFFTAMDVYVIVQLLGYGIRENKKRTHIDRKGGTNPRWNHRIKFTIDEPSLKNNTAISVLFQLKSERIFGSDRIIGEVTIPMVELYEDWVGVNNNNNAAAERVVDYQVRTSTRKPKGTLKISYKFGQENYVKRQQLPSSTEENNNYYNRNGGGGGGGFYRGHESVPAFPGTSMAYAAAAAGIGYPAPYPPAGYGGYPSHMAPCYPYPTGAAAAGGGGYHNGYAPPPPQQQQQQYPAAGYGYPAPPIMQQQYHLHEQQQQQQKTMKKKGKMGMGAAGVGMGLLGGMLVGDIVSDVGEMAAYSDAMAIGDAGFDF